MADLEPASALALRLPWRTHEELTALIEADRAAVREAALREAIEKLEIMAGSPLATGEQEQGLRFGVERLRKLLPEKRTHG
jgi:hypothetical protein